MIYEDGRTYKGNFQKDLKHGHGIYTWASGKQYDGNWAFGKQHGQGYIITVDG